MSKKITILIAQQNQQLLDQIAEMISSFGYSPLKAANSEEVIVALKQNDIHLLIVDSMLPKIDGYQLCQALKQKPKYAPIPIIIITSTTEENREQQCRNSKVDFVITKPVDELTMELIVNNLVKTRFMSDILQKTETLLITLVDKLEEKDQFTHGHSKRVKKYAVELAGRLELMAWDINIIEIAAAFHNIGYLFVDETLLRKKLVDDSPEKQEILKHVLHSEALCKSFNPSDEFLQIIRNHHEHFDGGGFPDGLSGNDIPIGARIIGIVEAYVAMTSPRNYRKKMDKTTACKVLSENAGKTWDPFLVKEFLKMING